ncbi:MAG: hypothetical protein JO301_07450 [Chitinophagaceae bacterium]|nr:hypothetical protein [Chitinophagaceae bacterium]
MKNRSLLLTGLMLIALAGFGQNEAGPEEGKGKFKNENIFIGTGLNLGIANRSFNAGINPEIGYSITRWLDAGVAVNLNYFSQNASDYSSIRYRNFNYGGGAFIRIWPVNFLHIQVQPEYNWISSSQRDVLTGQSGTFNYHAQSLLLGIGYGSRQIGNHYSYFTLMIDVLQNFNSPYRDQYNDPLPVFRAGIGFYLKPRHR